MDFIPLAGPVVPDEQYIPKISVFTSISTGLRIAWNVEKIDFEHICIFNILLYAQQSVRAKFTYTKSCSLPVSSNKFATGAVSSIRPPNVNTFISQFNSFKMHLIHL